MGWTGIYDWYGYEKNKDILNRQFFRGETKFEPVEWSQKGSHTWLLYRNKETQICYAAVILTKRYKKDHEFCYKEIGLDSGPCETDMPKKWLKLIDPAYFTNEHSFAKEWLEQYMKDHEKRTTEKVDFGDLFKCKNDNRSINWSDGFSIKPGEEFFIRVDPHHTRARTTKILVIAREQYGAYISTRYKLKRKTFDNIQKEKIRA